MIKSLTYLILAFVLLLTLGLKTKQKTDCRCFKGIGSTEKDEPVFTFNFSNNQSVSFCGYFDPKEHGSIEDINGFLLSEFNVFNCETGFSYAEFGATEICRIVPQKNTIEIQDLTYLPCGENWNWEYAVMAKQHITVKEDSLTISLFTPCYKSPVISEKLQNEFLNSIERGKGFDENYDVEIGKLEVLVLAGNQKAYAILMNYEKIKGQRTDGAIAEIWHDAVAEVKWILDK